MTTATTTSTTILPTTTAAPPSSVDATEPVTIVDAPRPESTVAPQRATVGLATVAASSTTLPKINDENARIVVDNAAAPDQCWRR